MEISNRTDRPITGIDLEKIKSLADNLLRDFYADELPDVSFSLVEAGEIRALNRRFRGIDDVTDILSFPSGNEIDLETGREFLGDLIICVQRAAEQAADGQHTLQDEISLLTIHGLLHLLGYDHGDADEKAEMWALQDEYILRNGLRLGKISGDEPF